MDNVNKNTQNFPNMIEDIKTNLDEAGYDYAVAIATMAEVNAGAACGQLSIIIDNQNN